MAKPITTTSEKIQAYRLKYGCGIMDAKEAVLSQEREDRILSLEARIEKLERLVRKLVRDSK